jgi:hypothetical protein
MFASAFSAPDTAFNREAGRCWFVSMIARIMEPGAKVDTMPVLQGPQGTLKSTALEIIGGKWYKPATSSVDSTNLLMEIHGTIVYEIPELHSILTSRHDSAKIKAVLSIHEDTFRAPYGRRPESHKRTAIFVGTTNDHGWHADNTGGRRFWVINVGDRIDLDWLKANRDQLFAEALHLWRAGGKWWDVPEDEQRALVEEERADNPWEDIIAGRLHDEALYDGWNSVDRDAGDGNLSESADWGTLVTTARIAIQWLRLPPEGIARHSKQIARIMHGIGWKHTRFRARRAQVPPRAWVRRSANATERGEIEENVHADAPQIAEEVQDDIPF